MKQDKSQLQHKSEKLYDKEFEKLILLQKLTTCPSIRGRGNHRGSHFRFNPPPRYSYGRERGNAIERRARGIPNNQPPASRPPPMGPGPMYMPNGPGNSFFVDPMAPMGYLPPPMGVNICHPGGQEFALLPLAGGTSMAPCYPYQPGMVQEHPPQSGRGGRGSSQGPHQASRGRGSPGHGRGSSARGRGSPARGRGRGTPEANKSPAAAAPGFQFNASKKQRGGRGALNSPEFAARPESSRKKKRGA